MSKKCLHILPMNKVSGAEKMALIMCKNMKSYEPVVVCGGNTLKSIFESNGIKSYALSFSNKNILKATSELKKIICENNASIIHAHDNTASLIGYLTKRIFNLNVRVISHIHNCYPWLKGSGFNKKLDSVVRPKYDHNITCGSLVYEYYKENAKYFNEAKVSSLSNAMDIEEIVKFDISNSEEVVNKYSIPKDKKVLGFIGRISEQKGIVNFIDEFAKYKECFEDSVVLLVGSGEQDTQVEELINKLNLNQLFILTGHQEETYKFYPLIDVFFLPSKYEGLPMVVLEAMAFKKTVVAMDVGSISEVVKNDTGFLVQAGDYRSFVCELKKIKNNKALLNAYGQNAYKYVNKNYNINNYVNAIESKYDELV